ncbi:isochorismatase family cysteine hydrolase [Acerihabitans sp.]|uniref:cysteine hydrolase family protein n=1 Tax=Acerihabitans sp. TaxID=2811394 RepID=UPI002EDB5423
MTAKRKNNPIIVGRPVLIVVDIQKGGLSEDDTCGIASMPGMIPNMQRARGVIDAARANGVPIIFLQEVHRPSGVDFGRELDGDEDEHLVEGWESTEIAADVVGLRPDDYVIQKRRYSGFIGTDLPILLRGLKAETLILVGGLTNVCIHYTFADGHQSDYHCRVVEDCVGGSDLAAHQAALTAMEYLQHGARRSAVEMIAAFGEHGRGALPLQASA